MRFNTIRLAILVPVCAALVLASCDRQTEWTTSSGLRVVELDPGDGERVKPGDVVSILYRASYVGGEEFDRSLNREAPYRFRAGMEMVLPGLDEGVLTMRRGGKRVLYLPPELAFEADPDKRPATVPAGASVKFEVELLEIEPGIPLPQEWSDAGYDYEVTESGIQYIDYVVGDGEHPWPGCTVVMSYSMYIDDGTLVDTNIMRGRPSGFVLDPETVLPGLMEGLLTMHVGGRRKIVVPPYLAYGEKGFGETIPPNATLTYDLALINAYETPQ